VILRGAAVVAQGELLQAEHPRTRTTRQPVGGGAADAAQTDHDILKLLLYRHLSCAPSSVVPCQSSAVSIHLQCSLGASTLGGTPRISVMCSEEPRYVVLPLGQRWCPSRRAPTPGSPGVPQW